MLVARSRLAEDLLEKLGLEPGGVSMVHCRMSTLGRVVGGAETVVRALLDTLGPDGTLMAYTGWQDAPPDDLGALDEETRRIYLLEHPAYDPRVALSRREHARIPEALRTWPGARHSGHPEAGVALSVPSPKCSPPDILMTTPTALARPKPGWSSLAAGWRSWAHRWTP